MRSRYFNIFEDLNEFYDAFTGCCPNNCQKSSTEGLAISEDEAHLYIDAQLPGVKPEEVEVTLDPKKRHLLIRGEGQAGRENVKYHIKGTQSYSYQIPLSNEIDVESNMEAISKDGVLRVTLSKNKSNKPLKIEVRVA